ncbi:MAG: glycosyltransferase family 9 protein, partial [Candidatus Omnitrophota bacterium]
ACGVPVIATRVGGIVDIIEDNESGILVPPKDWNSLSDAIIRLLKDKDLRQRLSKNGRVNVEKNFSLSHMYKKTIRVYNEALSAFRILVIKWSALGDIVLSLQALRSIRARFPKAHIVLLTSKEGMEFLSRYSYVNEFLIYKFKKGIEGAGEIIGISSELRKASTDMVIDLQNNKKSHMVSFLSFAPNRVGYKSKKLDFLMNNTIDGARLKMAPVAHQFRLLKLLGIDEIPPFLQLTISEEEKKYADSLFTEGWIGKNERLVGLNCGASQKWQTKWLSLSKMAKLCDILAQKKIRIVITGTKEDRQRARELLLLTRSKPLDVTGRTNIMQLAAVIQRCGVFITSDSAPMHLAALLEVPFVGLFGPTDPKRHLEPSKEYRVIYKNLKCSPCYKPRCSHKRCMESIEAEEITAAVLELLNKD